MLSSFKFQLFHQASLAVTAVRLVKTVFTAGCLAIMAISHAAASEQPAATILANNLANLTTYQATFEQKVSNDLGQVVDQSRGQFSIQRPNLFRWEITETFPQLIVADGENMWTYDPELEQVTIQNQSTMLADSPLLLMTSDAATLQKSYQISVHPLNDNKNKQLFLLKPLSKDSVFESVNLLFEEQRLIEILMQDTLGQKTSVQFSQIKMNEPLKDSLFKFVPPEGVDIVDSRTPVDE
ncbi:outer membrane lipoprotein chaperone LolA [Aliikangiella sp. IMCC44632]